jgi:hypothetical protein
MLNPIEPPWYVTRMPGGVDRGKVGRSWYVDETYIKVHGGDGNLVASV